jgi:hypothetical protein
MLAIGCYALLLVIYTILTKVSQLILATHYHHYVFGTQISQLVLLKLFQALMYHLTHRN